MSFGNPDALSMPTPLPESQQPVGEGNPEEETPQELRELRKRAQACREALASLGYLQDALRRLGLPYNDSVHTISGMLREDLDGTVPAEKLKRTVDYAEENMADGLETFEKNMRGVFSAYKEVRQYLKIGPPESF